MRHRIVYGAAAAILAATAFLATVPLSANEKGRHDESVQLGPRPFFLVDDMKDGWLKKQLQRCTAGPFSKSDFSIGHRGAALQFPEHTRESYEAGARLGAGILECDVTFTKDLQLVCRHAQNDLHTTTNILVTPLAATCTKPFTPAVIAPNGTLTQPATAECRTSDITLAEFKTLRGKMDAFDPRALTPEQFQGGHGQLPQRSLRRTDQRRAPDPRREHRAVQEARRQDDARAEGAERDDAIQRLQPGGLRAEDDRRVQAGWRLATPGLPAIVQPRGRPVLDRSRTGVRPPGRVPG
jgi:hypothetical protein